MWRRTFPFAVLVVVLSAKGQTGWKMVWSDEFSGPANSQPDSTKWAYDLGGGGWGNAELETYTNAPENAHLDGNGNLIIRALRTASGVYTSGRLKTQGKFEVTYGKIEARIKLPFGQGIWPAFWLLGSNIDTVGWPACGEIDIMENVGREPSINHGSMHGPGYSGANSITATYALSGGKRFADDFHLFTVVWSPGSVEFLVDSISYQKVTSASLPQGKQWVFNSPFFLLLNVAVGGTFTGYPDATTQFPQEMTVDYVHVYQAVPAPAINPGGMVNAASFTSALAPGSLASLFGIGLADHFDSNLFDKTTGMFPQSAGTTTVSLNGVLCPLIYVSPDQINFQIPWEVPVGMPVSVQVFHDAVPSNMLLGSFTATAPSAFSANGRVILTCVGGTACTLWGNGFGFKSPAQQDGVPSNSDPLPVTVVSCRLVIEGIEANVSYCGAAPSLVIDQLNFDFPPAIPGTEAVVHAILTIGDESSELLLPRDQ